MNVDINLAGGEVYGQRNLITQEEVVPRTPQYPDDDAPPEWAMVKLPGQTGGAHPHLLGAGCAGVHDGRLSDPAAWREIRS